MTSTQRTEHFETVIVGGGQAGLAVGYHLTKRGHSCVILDANDRIGDSWRKRWPSLRLYSPARADGLPGMRFPAPSGSFPSGLEMADYLEAYAQKFALPVRTGVAVDGLETNGDGYVVVAGERRFEADNVVVATGVFQHDHPVVPEFAAELDPRIRQLHSADYR
ncbi:MAG: flavin-containing monooxygenase, partial [Gaiellaceae bacterium]